MLLAARLGEVEPVPVKPCPRCGAKGRLFDAKDGVSYPFRVLCTKCPAGTLCFNAEIDAVMDWNKGKLDDPISDDVQDD